MKLSLCSWKSGNKLLRQHWFIEASVCDFFPVITEGDHLVMEIGAVEKGFNYEHVL